MSETSDSDIELQELLADLLDGSLDPDSRRRLNDRLSNDMEAQQTYLDFCEAHAALAREHGLVVADIQPTTLPRARSMMSGKTWVRFGAIMGTLAASWWFALIWWNSGSSRGSGGQDKTRLGRPVVAQLMNRIDAVVTCESVDWESDEIRVGKYEIKQGLIQLRFESGVTLLIEAPAAIDAISAEKLALHKGRLSATVPPEGTGFTVETPEADIVDFGTQFSIEVGGGESEVHVFQGHVQIHPKRDSVHEPGMSIDLRTKQAIRMAESTGRPVGIDLATDRFIRSIDEPQIEYPRLVRLLEPVAYYRMPIRERGLVCHPSKYDGKILTGSGSHPACAPGIVGGSLRVGGRSIGRGAVVDQAPSLKTGSFALSCWIYATGRPKGATIVSDVQGQEGHFALSLDQNSGRLVATVRENQGQFIHCNDVERLPLKKWHHVTVTGDGRTLTLFRNGSEVASSACSPISTSAATSLRIGVASEGLGLWEGRIDELALFDRALTPEQVEALYEAVPHR